MAVSPVVTIPRLQDQPKEILQQMGENGDVPHGLPELEFSLVVVTLYARFCDCGFAGGNKETFDWLAGRGSRDDPRVPKFTGLRQIEGLDSEARQGGKVVIFESENVSARIHPDVGAEEGEGESVVFDWGVTDDREHQVLPFRLPGLWVLDSLCAIPPVGDGGLHLELWREV